MTKYRYKNLLFFGTLQFCGNLTEYFIENCDKLVVYYVMPRNDAANNMVRLYRKGVLKKEQVFYSPSNIVLCYILLYINYLRILFTYFNSKENFFVFCGHPLFSFFKSILNKFRTYDVIYFVGDYYPGTSMLNIIYRAVFTYYHKRSKCRIYLSDRLNKINNGKVINTKFIKTVMWGVNPKLASMRKISKNQINICFIGVLRDSQGVDLLLEVVKKTKDVRLKLLGTPTAELDKKYSSFIAKNQLQERVFFPKKSYYGSDLEDAIKDCAIGVALYDVGPQNGTYYADPAKIKTYTQFGLPVIMTDAAQVAQYIKKYNAGEIVASNATSVIEAIRIVRNNYEKYLNGVSQFNSFFNYKTYYKYKLRFMEL